MKQFVWPLMIIAFAAGGCCIRVPSAGERAASPDETLAQVEAAVERGDVTTLRGQLSAETVAYVGQQHGLENVDAAVEFLMHLLRAEGRWQVVGRRYKHGTAILNVQKAQQADKRSGELKFVREHGGAWKLDMVEAFQAWDELAGLAGEVQEKMLRATPFLGKEAREPLEP